MKVSIYCPMIIPVNPWLDQYGGLELIAGLLAKYIDDLEGDNEVNLFATNGSYQPRNGNLYYAGEAGAEFGKIIDPSNYGGVNPADAWNKMWTNEVSKNALKDSDIVCDMSWNYWPYLVHSELKHLCHVHHGPDPGFITKPSMDNPNLIGVGFNHAKQLERKCALMGQPCNWMGLQNGIYLDKYPYQEKKEDYLLWVGRIYAFKGTHRFINICNSLKMKGIIVGGSFGDVEPYVNQVKGMCEQSKYVDYLGEVKHNKKVELYQNAKAVLLPSVETLPGTTHDGKPASVSFIEPFGLITPEANACGTPTIVIPSGGWQETMIHGYNGFFAVSDKEFMYYTHRVNEISPVNCRKMAEYFDYRRMGGEYMKMFNYIIGGGGW